jgi:hypothetical protein
MDYPKITEQLSILNKIKNLYGNNIKIDRWSHKDHLIFFEISNHIEYIESDITCDFYAKRIRQTNIKYLIHNRQTHKTIEATKQELFKKRGWIFNEKGFIQYYKENKTI